MIATLSRKNFNEVAQNGYTERKAYDLLDQLQCQHKASHHNISLASLRKNYLQAGNDKR